MDVSRIVELCMQSEVLKQLERTGWSIAGVTTGRKESIAEHSWGVSFISWMLSMEQLQQDVSFDLSVALAMSILHDLPESIMSDIPHSAVSLGVSELQAGKSKAELAAMDLIFTHFEFLGIEAKSLLNRLQKAECQESRVVLSADILDMLMHASRLEMNGVSPIFLEPFFKIGVRRITGYGIPSAAEIASFLNAEHDRRKDGIIL